MEVTGRPPPAQESVSSGERRRDRDGPSLEGFSQAGPPRGKVWSRRPQAPEGQLNKVQKRAPHMLFPSSSRTVCPRLSTPRDGTHTVIQESPSEGCAGQALRCGPRGL